MTRGNTSVNLRPKSVSSRTAGMTAVLRQMKRAYSGELRGLPDRRWAWTVNMDSIFTWSSPESYSAIGYRPQELIGRHVDLVMSTRELARAEAMVNATGVPQDGLSNLIISAVHRDGSLPWFEVSVQSSTDETGAIVGFRGVARYIGPETAQVLVTQQTRERIERVIDSGLLMTAFQPIVDARTSSVIGVEGLSRFVEDPGAAPDVWFAEAAAVGLGTALELHAVRTAFAAAKQLPCHLYVSVNLSPAACLDPSLFDVITASGIDPRRLIVEVTEHSRVADYDPLTAALTALRAHGIRIAVDDAGAGFSSGQHILRIKPDVIKLDRGIITAIDTEPGQRALAAGLTAFAEHIGARVTAEGVETLGEARCVRELGIHSVQGYFYGRPTVEVSEWATWTTPASQTTSHTAPPLTTTDLTAHRPTTQSSTTHASTELGADPATRWDAPGERAPNVTDGVRAGIRWNVTHGAPAGDRLLPGRAAAHDGSPRYGAFEVAVLDALADATAVLDRTGVIVAVNKAWRMFTVDSGGQPDTTGVGTSYLEVCSRSAAAGCSDALQALVDLQAVLSGSIGLSESEYACETPFGTRWFISRVTALGGGAGAVISHVDITRRKRSEEELAHRASHDPLTGLANRLMFGDQLAQALRRRPMHLHRPYVGVLYLDLDQFKPINDAFGHAAGDELLALAAHRLVNQARPSDIVARIGGDEFAVCARDITADGLATMSDRISVALGAPYYIRGNEVCVPVSVGAYLATAGDDPSAVLRAADRSMYAAKQSRARHRSVLSV